MPLWIALYFVLFCGGGCGMGSVPLCVSGGRGGEACLLCRLVLQLWYGQWANALWHRQWAETEMWRVKRNNFLALRWIY